VKTHGVPPQDLHLSSFLRWGWINDSGSGIRLQLLVLPLEVMKIGENGISSNGFERNFVVI
jgi:hypothetical protein